MTSPRAGAAAGQGPQTALVALVAIGAVAFVYGVVLAPVQAWGMYLVNLLFWSSLAITGPALAGVMQLTEARWSPSAKRVAVTTAGFLPVSLVLFVILFAGRAVLYPWVSTPVPAKAAWLNVPFMSLRIGVGVVLLYWVATVFVRAVFAEGEGGDGEAGRARRTRLASLMLVLYVVVLSLWGFDLLMSLDPVWYSGLFGGHYVVTSLYTGFALVCFLTIRANARGLVHVSPAGIQDLAKLVFAMCVMWMYFFFSQYLVIWYGNVPVETRFFLRRFFVDPWRTLAFVIFIVGALIPFGYLLKRLTGRPPGAHKPLVVVIVMAWIAIFLERIMIVFPSLSKDNAFPLDPRSASGLAGLAVTAGFFALFVLSRNRFLSRYGASLDKGR
jgi:Ni/Fe-hydrogenase subunit HybB-like protein